MRTFSNKAQLPKDPSRSTQRLARKGHFHPDIMGPVSGARADVLIWTLTWDGQNPSRPCLRESHTGKGKKEKWFYQHPGISSPTSHLLTAAVWGLLCCDMRTPRGQRLCLIQRTVTSPSQPSTGCSIEREFIITIQWTQIMKCLLQCSALFSPSKSRQRFSHVFISLFSGETENLSHRPTPLPLPCLRHLPPAFDLIVVKDDSDSRSHLSNLPAL